MFRTSIALVLAMASGGLLVHTMGGIGDFPPVTRTTRLVRALAGMFLGGIVGIASFWRPALTA